MEVMASDFAGRLFYVGARCPEDPLPDPVASGVGVFAIEGGRHGDPPAPFGQLGAVSRAAFVEVRAEGLDEGSR